MPGQCRGEILAGGRANIGQVVQPRSPHTSNEFTYIVAAVTLNMAKRQQFMPGVMMIMAPTRMTKKILMLAPYSRAAHYPR